MNGINLLRVSLNIYITRKPSLAVYQCPESIDFGDDHLYAVDITIASRKLS